MIGPFVDPSDALINLLAEENRCVGMGFNDAHERIFTVVDYDEGDGLHAQSAPRARELGLAGVGTQAEAHRYLGNRDQGGAIHDDWFADDGVGLRDAAQFLEDDGGNRVYSHARNIIIGGWGGEFLEGYSGQEMPSANRRNNLAAEAVQSTMYPDNSSNNLVSQRPETSERENSLAGFLT